ncbi:hypothetical protein WJX72_006537 [[Myrmecia] bisecta]|uniref:Uncharacterized protein n=1 Tax=[Myrmecia] bisecta TaxID=41462 RepID=A0AAW1PHN1_9CHLO
MHLYIATVKAAKQETETLAEQKQPKPSAPADTDDSSLEGASPDNTETLSDASQQEVADLTADASEIKQEGDQIYLGFDKSDTGSRTGRQGRVIVDSPEKYPEKTALTGGWAGGEQGLQAFVEEEKRKKGSASSASSGGSEKKGSSKPAADTDPNKLPSKDSIGIFDGVTGGFAGGERGVQQFVEEGDIKLAEPGSRSGQWSILAIASVVAIAGTVGGVLLTGVTDVGEEVVKEEFTGAIKTAPVDDSTKLLLELALALIGVTVVVGGGRLALKSLTGRLRESAVNLASLALFIVGLYIAARFVLESS